MKTEEKKTIKWLLLANYTVLFFFIFWCLLFISVTFIQEPNIHKFTNYLLTFDISTKRALGGEVLSWFSEKNVNVGDVRIAGFVVGVCLIFLISTGFTILISKSTDYFPILVFLAFLIIPLGAANLGHEFGRLDQINYVLLLFTLPILIKSDKYFSSLIASVVSLVMILVHGGALFSTIPMLISVTFLRFSNSNYKSIASMILVFFVPFLMGLLYYISLLGKTGSNIGDKLKQRSSFDYLVGSQGSVDNEIAEAIYQVWHNVIAVLPDSIYGFGGSIYGIFIVVVISYTWVIFVFPQKNWFKTLLALMPLSPVFIFAFALDWYRFIPWIFLNITIFLIVFYNGEDRVIFYKDRFFGMTNQNGQAFLTYRGSLLALFWASTMLAFPSSQTQPTHIPHKLECTLKSMPIFPAEGELSIQKNWCIEDKAFALQKLGKINGMSGEINLKGWKKRRTVEEP